MIIDLDLIDALENGLQGPQKFCGITWFVLRISGVGAAWRPGKNELCFRLPEVWLTPSMIVRWAGAPVVWFHPKKGVLDTESFVNTVIGSVVRAFVRNNELMAVARIADGDAAALLATGNFDTSPSVILPDTTEPIILRNGGKVLVERKPVAIDHLAICEKGVWTRNGDPGVEN